MCECASEAISKARGAANEVLLVLITGTSSLLLLYVIASPPSTTANQPDYHTFATSAWLDACPHRMPICLSDCLPQLTGCPPPASKPQTNCLIEYLTACLYSLPTCQSGYLIA